MLVVLFWVYIRGATEIQEFLGTDLGGSLSLELGLAQDWPWRLHLLLLRSLKESRRLHLILLSALDARLNVVYR